MRIFCGPAHKCRAGGPCPQGQGPHNEVHHSHVHGSTRTLKVTCQNHHTPHTTHHTAHTTTTTCRFTHRLHFLGDFCETQAVVSWSTIAMGPPRAVGMTAGPRPAGRRIPGRRGRQEFDSQVFGHPVRCMHAWVWVDTHVIAMSESPPTHPQRSWR